MKKIQFCREEIEERLKKLPKKNDITTDDYNCPDCRDTTYILNEDGLAYPCKCKAKVLLESRLKQSGMSNILKSKTFSNYIVNSESQREAKNKSIDFCIKFINDKEYSKSILYCGKSGAGKSHLAGATVMNLIENNVNCTYLDYIRFIAEARQSKYDDDKYNKLITKYQDSSVLCVDDFLKGRIEPGDINYVFELINYRYQTMKPIIITTEKKIEELFTYDEALASRLIEMCGGINGNIITFKDKNSNYRLRDSV